MITGLDLELAGKRAIVCGSSRGLGKACATALAQAGVDVLINGRNPATLQAAKTEIEQNCGRRVEAVVADVCTEEGRTALLQACPEPDVLVTNAAGPAPGDFRDWGMTEWSTALEANMLTPIMLMRATIDAMVRRKWGRIINITSGAVKAPLPLLGLSNGARSGLTGFVAGLAREVALHGVTINNLLPGMFDTDRLRGYAKALAAKEGVTFEVMRQRLADANPARRVGTPAEFGTVCAFLASNHAGYINGQNILMDGGAYPGVF